MVLRLSVAPALPAVLGLPVAGELSGLAGVLFTDTAAIAGSANAIPASEAAPGRSPSSSPASTENAADPTALTELTTLNAA